MEPKASRSSGSRWGYAGAGQGQADLKQSRSRANTIPAGYRREQVCQDGKLVLHVLGKCKEEEKVQKTGRRCWAALSGLQAARGRALWQDVQRNLTQGMRLSEIWLSPTSEPVRRKPAELPRQQQTG